MVNSLLFNPYLNKAITKMDDSKSMVSLAVRDGVETSGRTIMEYKRDPHGGRERLIEESATMVIWAFGINWMKRLYDRIAPRLDKRIALPDLDAALLKNETVSQKPGLLGYFSQPSSQSLVTDEGQKTLKAFSEKFKGDYAELAKVVGDKALQKVYSNSNVLKFLFATGIPVAIIGFGIPTFNQWLTRRILGEEKAKKMKNQPAGGQHPFGLSRPSLMQNPQGYNGSAQNPSGHNPGGMYPSAFAMPHSPQWAASGKSQPAYAFSAPPPPHMGVASGGASMAFNSPANGPAHGNNGAQPMNRPAFRAFPQQPFGTTTHPRSGGQPHFGGGLGDLASNFLQNERMNTLLVDGTISGGRIYKARNWQERAEIIFREGCIITFLYFAQKAIQDFISNRLQGHSQLSFDSTKYLHDTYKGDSAKFMADFRHAFDDLNKHHFNGELLNKIHAQDEQQGLSFWRNLFHNNGQKKIIALQASHYDMEKTLVERIRKHFMEGGSKPNLIIDTAKHCGWIPTLSNGHLDLSKKIDVEPIWNLIKHLRQASETMAKQVAEKGAHSNALEHILTKAIQRRTMAWVLSNMVCTFFLSYLCPKIQHKITYWRTGKDFFPGIQPS